MATRILPGNLGADYVGPKSFFKPNTALLNEALAGKQLDYDTKLAAYSTIKAKVDEVNALEGYDKDRHSEISDDYHTKVDEIMGLYGGDLTKGTAELAALTKRVGKDFGIYGEMTALKSRYDGYTANNKEITERLKKGEVTEVQAYGLRKALKDTSAIGIGTDMANWNPWGEVKLINAVNRPELLEKYIKDFKADSQAKWGQGSTRYSPAGVLEWRKPSGEWVTEESIHKGGQALLATELERTGEMKAEWVYEQEVRGGGGTQEKYDGFVGDAKSKVTQYSEELNAVRTLKGKELQTKVNEIYKLRTGRDLLEVDGVVGNKTIAAQKKIIEVLTKDVESATIQYNKISGIDENGFPKENHNPVQVANNMLYDKFRARLLHNAVQPFAEKGSYNKTDEDLKTMKDPSWEFDADMKLLAASHAHRVEELNVAYRLKEGPYITMSRMDQGMQENAPFKDLTEMGIQKDEISTLEGAMVTDLFTTLLNMENATAPDGEKLTGEELHKATLERRNSSGLSSNDLANATNFEINGKTLTVRLEDGTVKVLSKNYTGDMNIIYGQQRIAKDLQTRRNTLNQVYNETMENVLADPENRFSDDEIKAYREYDKLIKEHTPAIKTAYAAWKAENPSDPTPYSKWVKDNIGRAFRPPTKVSVIPFVGNSYEEQPIPSWATELHKVFKGVAFNYRDLHDKVSTGFNKHVKNWQKNTSSAASNEYFDYDGNPANAKAMENYVNDYFTERENTDSLPMTLVHPKTGQKTVMTPMQYMEALKEVSGNSGKNYTYSVASSVMVSDKHDAFSLPITFYELGDNNQKSALGGKAIHTYVSFNDASIDLLHNVVNNAERKFNKNVVGTADAGVTQSKHTQYNPATESNFEYSIHLGGNQGNVGTVNTPNDGYVKIGAHKVPTTVVASDGKTYAEVEYYYDNGVRKVRRVYKDVAEGVKSLADGERDIVSVMEYENQTRMFNQLGISNTLVPIKVHRTNKDGQGLYYKNSPGRPVMDTYYYDRYEKLSGLMNHKGQIDAKTMLETAQTLGLNQIQTGQLFDLRVEGIKYKDYVRLTAEELARGGTTTFNTSKTYTR